MTTRADLPRISAQIRLAGEILDAHGADAWDTTIDWDRGVKAQALTGTGGGSEVSNPTMRDATANMPTEERPNPKPEPDHHRTLLAILERMARDARELTNLINLTNPSLTIRPTIAIDTTIGEEGWCVSCHRDDRHCEPVSKNYEGRKHCRFCGDWQGAHGFLPPLDILRDRHQGRRITKQRVDQAINDHRNDNRKKRRKGKAA